MFGVYQMCFLAAGRISAYIWRISDTCFAPAGPLPDIRRYTPIYGRYKPILVPPLGPSLGWWIFCLLLGMGLMGWSSDFSFRLPQTQVCTTCGASGSMYTASTRIMRPVGRCTVRVVCAQTRALTLEHGTQSKKNWGSKAAAMPIRAGAAVRRNSNSELQRAGVQKLHVSTIFCLKS